jgi:hypothetical protein
MTKEFVPYELAVKLKALGFDEPCLGLYYPDGKFNIKEQNGLNCDSDKNSYLDSLGNSAGFCTAPLYQQVFRWFRENGFLISLSSHNEDEHDFYFKWSEDKSILSDIYDTYEEAEIACLEKLIEIIETKQLEQ